MISKVQEVIVKMQRVFLFVIALALVATACHPPAQEPAGLSAKDVEAIKALGASVDEAVLALDWDRFVALTTEDVSLMFPNNPTIRGGAAFKAWIEALGPDKSIEHRLEFIDIDGYEDVAYARGTYTEKYTLKDFAEPFEDTGKLLLVLRKQANGSWLVSIWIHNSDLPLSEGGDV